MAPQDVMGDRSPETFTHVELPIVRRRVLRLGVAGNYGLETADIHYAAERGVNFWLWTPTFRQVTPALREILARHREAHVVSLLVMGITAGMVRRAVDKALRQLQTDYLDLCKLAWLNRTAFLTGSVRDQLLELKEAGKIRATGASIHDRLKAGQLAREQALDAFMIRYNAKHPGAEEDIFPHLNPQTALISYTTTSWSQLIRPLKGIEMRPWPGAGEPPPPPLDPVHCYRFSLSSPHVHVVLTGPKNRAQLDENLTALEGGRLSVEEDQWIREYGRLVKQKKRLPFV